MRRREFIAGVFGTAALPPAAMAAERMRRVGILQGTGENASSRARTAAVREGLRQLGWVEGRNVTFDTRYGAGNPDMLRKYAEELVALAPDVIVASGSSATTPLQQATRTVPIVFAIVPDPVGSGLVRSLARPGGNITGFIQSEFNLSGKWLELLKEIAPGVNRAAVLRDPTVVAGIGQFAVIQAVAPSLGIDVSPVNIRDLREVERDVASFAQLPNGGLILTSTPLLLVHGKLLVELAARHKLPAVVANPALIRQGGLIFYGPDFLDQFRRASGYVDRILRGEKPADLPVQAPTKYDLVINLKTARTLGLVVPPALLARADRVIE